MIRRPLIWVAALAIVWATCETASAQKKGPGKKSFAGIEKAIAVIHPTAGNQCKGIVVFTQVGKELKVVADIEGLKPNSTHAIHVHQFGDCSSPDGKSAGGHYNPEGHMHAGPKDKKRHAGDLGNLTADAQGKAHYELTVKNASIVGKNAILGRGVIIHAGEDDLKTQPTGAAGARIGCGVIGVANTKVATKK